VGEGQEASEEGSTVGLPSVAESPVRSPPHKKAAFVGPRDCLPVRKLPEGSLMQASGRME
jgi:hypothetical protein